jgi:hypothetical protein
MHKQDIITFIIFHKKPTKTYTLRLSNSLLKKMFYSSHWQLEKLFKNELFSRMKSCSNLFLKTLRDREIFQFSWQIIPSFCTMVAKISLQCICSWFCQFQHSKIILRRLYWSFTEMWNWSDIDVGTSFFRILRINKSVLTNLIWFSGCQFILLRTSFERISHIPNLPKNIFWTNLPYFA